MDAILRRVVRRETHSPRTVATVIVLALVAIGAAYAGTEIVLRLLDARPLLVAPGAALSWIEGLPDAEPKAAVIAGAAVAAIVGVVLMVLAVTPGRRPKHQFAAASHAVVVDNGVIASAVAERVRRELDLSRGGVVVGVGHRGVDVTVRPEPGQSIERSLVRSVAEAEIAEYRATPRLRVRARVQRADRGGEPE